ncbi:MAG: GNAT family N-acetyltransferase [Proteobacteria bacterium]|nr:GNAT family N-acetyltransferase [Pseudomonadota bacterium]MBU1386866.1 GNAT family N-acetyltransferase [Pseudomonadota bacterium]MBU1541433.1 GNAT family N-acetyltransferase [Pseudomonadota bacterium]MBU2480035.1 GNAT family N-acetyltransferase [Pseudomonadota bacterium]
MMYLIGKTDQIEDIIPAFKKYLNYMSRYYDIRNIKAWQEKAVKNLGQDVITEDCQVYVLKKNDDIAGFAVVNRHLRFNPSGRAIAEFYIQKGLEGKGYGRKLAEYVFSRFEGCWEVAVTAHNNPAQIFWKKVISSYTSGDYSEKSNTSINDHGFLFNRKTA